MSTIPPWIIGRNVTLFSIAPCTVATNGVVTVGTTVPLAGLCDEINLDLENETENIVAFDVRQNNKVIVGTGQAITLVEILNAAAVLANAGIANDYCQITYTRGGKAWTGIFVILGYKEGIRRGKSTGELSVAEAGIPIQYA